MKGRRIEVCLLSWRILLARPEPDEELNVKVSVAVGKE